MEINILSTRNGVGLERDANRLMSILTEDGHSCHFIDVGKGGSPKKADVNIFCEHFNRANFTRMAQRNYLFPNPEWFHNPWLRNIDLLTGVLCKTKDAENIFSHYTDKVIHTGFTSVDLYNPQKQRQKLFFHSAGKSQHKGTGEVLSVWNGNDMPNITITHQMNARLLINGNINYAYRYFSDTEYAGLLNNFQFHICPSHYEGWGHYIHESKSTGAIIVTTDGEPMNEFVNHKFGYLCQIAETKNKDLANMKIIAHSALIEAVNKCMALSDSQIEVMSQESRKSYLEGEKSFKEKFLAIINQ